MESTLKYRVVAVLSVIGFAVAMTLRDELASICMRVLLVVVAGVFQCMAYLYALRRGREIEIALRHRIMLALGVMGFAIAMTARDELSSIYTRSLLGGVAGGFIGVGIGVFQTYRRHDRQ